MSIARQIVNPKIGIQALIIVLFFISMVNLILLIVSHKKVTQLDEHPKLWMLYKLYARLGFVAVLFLSVIVFKGIEDGPCGTDTTKLKSVIAMACMPAITFLLAKWSSEANDWERSDRRMRMESDEFKYMVGLMFGQFVFYLCIIIPVLIAFLVQDYSACEYNQVHGIEAFIHAKSMSTVSLMSASAFCAFAILTFGAFLRSVDKDYSVDVKNSKTYHTFIVLLSLSVIAYIVYNISAGFNLVDINQERKDCPDHRALMSVIIGLLPVGITIVITMIWAAIHSMIGWDDFHPYLVGGFVAILSTVGCMAYCTYNMYTIVTQPKKCDNQETDNPQVQTQGA